MALEDLASLRAVFGSTVLYPSDPNQTAALMAEIVDRKGIVFLRTTREKLPVIYPPGDRFEIGGSRVVRSSDADVVTLVAAGITVHEALAAASLLAPAPTPWMSLNAIIDGMDPARPANAEPSRKMPIPASITGLRP